jgi:hypothetical protein
VRPDSEAGITRRIALATLDEIGRMIGRRAAGNQRRGSRSLYQPPSARATLSAMEICEYRQKNPVADEVGALVAVTRPVIAGVLQSVSAEIAKTFGEPEMIPLKMLGRLRKVGEGDCGIAFEYAIHHAVMSREPGIIERVADALAKLRIHGDPVSILFAIEKSGAQQLISTEPSLVTDHSSVLLGDGARPVALREHLSATGAAFRLPSSLLNLTQSIRGRWKTDLFLGSGENDQWVTASVNISPAQLRPANGPAIAIIPSEGSASDAVRIDEQKNLAICPVPHDASFMQIFYAGWKLVQTLCTGNFEMPREADIPSAPHREVARIYAERRDFSIGAVIEAIRKFAQPELLTTSTEVVSHVSFETTAAPTTSTIITPIPRTETLAASI